MPPSAFHRQQVELGAELFVMSKSCGGKSSASPSLPGSPLLATSLGHQLQTNASRFGEKRLFSTSTRSSGDPAEGFCPARIEVKASRTFDPVARRMVLKT